MLIRRGQYNGNDIQGRIFSSESGKASNLALAHDNFESHPYVQKLVFNKVLKSNSSGRVHRYMAFEPVHMTLTNFLTNLKENVMATVRKIIKKLVKLILSWHEQGYLHGNVCANNFMV